MTLAPTNRLDDLAATIRGELEDLHGALNEALGHALAAGKALLEAYDLLPAADWPEWVRNELDTTPQTAGRYMRLYHYRDHIPEAIIVPDGTPRRLAKRHAATPNGVYAAYIRGLPPLDPTAPRNGLPDHVKAEIVRLRDSGATYEAIAEILRVSTASVWRVLEPEASKRRAQISRAKARREKAARIAIEEAEERKARDRLARTTGGELAKAYSHVRRALNALDLAGEHGPMPHLHRAEDAIVELLRR